MVTRIAHTVLLLRGLCVGPERPRGGSLISNYALLPGPNIRRFTPIAKPFLLFIDDQCLFQDCGVPLFARHKPYSSVTQNPHAIETWK